MNAALTTEINIAGSHLELWKPFTKYVFTEILSVERVPTIFLGKDAAKFAIYSNSLNLVLSHPASASYQNKDWDSKGAYKQVSTVLKEVKKTRITR